MTSIRPATPEDHEAVAEMERTCLGDDAWSPGLIAEGLSGRVPTVQYLVAETARAVGVEGYAAVSVAGDIAELQRIAVDPQCRRAGIGRTLLTAAIEKARTGGAERFLLEVRADNAGAIALYSAVGLTEIDRRPRYYRDGATAVVMSIDLA